MGFMIVMGIGLLFFAIFSIVREESKAKERYDSVPGVIVVLPIATWLFAIVEFIVLYVAKIQISVVTKAIVAMCAFAIIAFCPMMAKKIYTKFPVYSTLANLGTILILSLVA